MNYFDAKMNSANMALLKDPAIKLFGRKISIPHTQILAKSPSKNNCSETTKEETNILNEDNLGEPDKSTASVQSKKENISPLQVKETLTTSKKEGDEEKIFKKPDKVLPCPRCKSSDTKFCYFNNYNVNQPRHFCKNCQRYWTAGGTMRNVPIGAGRRKNKFLASQYRQILVSTEMEKDSTNQQLVSSVESATSLCPSTTGNGMVLKFGHEAPICDSMETVLNLAGQKSSAEINSVSFQDNVEEPSLCGSSMMTPSCGENNSHSSKVQWCPTPILAVPAGFCPPNFPLQFIPASYWGCMPIAEAGNMSANGFNGCSSPSSSTSTSCCSGNGSSKLGTHCKRFKS